MAGVGGDDESLYVDDVPPELLCSHCKKVMRDAMKIKSCEHGICSTCYQGKKSNPKEPLCETCGPQNSFRTDSGISSYLTLKRTSSDDAYVSVDHGRRKRINKLVLRGASNFNGEEPEANSHGTSSSSPTKHSLTQRPPSAKPFNVSQDILPSYEEAFLGAMTKPASIQNVMVGDQAFDDAYSRLSLTIAVQARQEVERLRAKMEEKEHQDASRDEALAKLKQEESKIRTMSCMANEMAQAAYQRAIEIAENLLSEMDIRKRQEERHQQLHEDARKAAEENRRAAEENRRAAEENRRAASEDRREQSQINQGIILMLNTTNAQLSALRASSQPDIEAFRANMQTIVDNALHAMDDPNAWHRDRENDAPIQQPGRPQHPEPDIPLSQEESWIVQVISDGEDDDVVPENPTDNN